MNAIIEARRADYVPILTAPSTPAALVCFHFAGGSAQSFFRWRRLGQGCCDLIAAELPGRGRRTRESFIRSIPELAERLADAATAFPDKPCVFFGHSLGALIAYETARILHARGHRVPDRLIVSARQSPGWEPATSGLPALDEDALRDYLHNLAGTPKAVLENEDLMRMTIPILRADLQLIYNHRHLPGEQLNIPVEAIGAIGDDYVAFESLLGWRNTTSDDFRLHMIQGGHFAIMENPGIVFEVIRNIPNGKAIRHAPR